MEINRVSFCIAFLLGFWWAAAEALPGSTAVARGLYQGVLDAIGDVQPGAGGSQLLGVSEEVGHWLSESQAKWWKSREVLESYGRSAVHRGVGGLVEGMVAVCMLQGVAEKDGKHRTGIVSSHVGRRQLHSLALPFSYAIARRGSIVE